MKKIFTLIAVAMMAVSANAQTEWNFSDWTVETITTKTVNGLTVYSNAEKPVAVDANSKTVGDVTYTKRLKLGGASVFDTDGTTPLSRILAFDVTGPVGIDIVLTTSNKTDDRVLCVDAVVSGSKSEVTTVNCTANELATKHIDYAGGAATIYLYSQSGGINIYDIKYSIKNAISNITTDAANSNAPIYNLAGQQVSKDFKGVCIQNGKKFINK